MATKSVLGIVLAGGAVSSCPPYTPLHFQFIAHPGACGKTRVVPHNGWPGQEPTQDKGLR